MRLTQLKLSGFKSFVDPTVIAFPTNLVGILGPNGCGKSNVMDAIKWVMGESSAKQLRGESLTDVIFNGSAGRKPLGQASVELVFENSDAAIGGAYAAYPEVAIRRVLTREGKSDYFINNTRCRRRDVIDIFLGTGLGPRSYAIIEQGMISRFIEAKPEDLRVFIEEAAGISKYKERRRETERRIGHTRENLDRLNDLREELGKQLEKLQRQSKAAERYKVLKADEHRFQFELYALKWRNLDEQFGTFSGRIREQEVALESLIADVRQEEGVIEKHRLLVQDAREGVEGIQKRFYGVGSDIARLEQSLGHAKSRAEQLNADLQQLEGEMRVSIEQRDGDVTREQEAKDEWESLQPQLKDTQEKAATSQTAFTSAELAMQVGQSEWDTFNQAAATHAKTADVSQARIQSLENRLADLQKRKQSLTAEQSQLDLGEQEKAIEGEARLIQEAQEAKAVLMEQRDTLSNEQKASREILRAVTREWDDAKGQWQACRGKLASLEALQQAALITDDDSVSNWMGEKGWSQNARLGQQLSVEEGWEIAVETVLGDALEAVMVPGWHDALSSLPKGRAMLIGSATSAVSTGLASKVTGEHGGLLNSIFTAETLDEALARLSQLQSHESIVTKEGVWCSPHWLRLAKGKNESDSVLKRQRELEQVSKEIDAITLRVEALENSRTELEAQSQAWTEQQDALQQQLSEAQAHYANVKAQCHVKRERYEALKKRLSRIEEEIVDVAAAYERADVALTEERQQWQTAMDAMASDADKREQLVQGREGVQQQLLFAREQANQCQKSAHELQLQSQSLEARQRAAYDSHTRLTQQLEQLSARNETHKVHLTQAIAPIEGWDGELQTALALRANVEGELTEAKQALSSLEHVLTTAEKKRAVLSGQVDGAREGLEKTRLSGQTVKVQRDTLKETIDEADEALATLLTNLPEEATEESWGHELERIAVKIQRLGAINLAAIEEYDVQAERKHYLDAQNNDLVEALDVLESAIRKIDKETRARFKDTFEKVNAGFSRFFPRLFGGGNAQLVLTGDDLLNTGITVMAQPPGKRNATIHLLSGGEKALTAIALVFSIFELNPAPFCLLDEVDAPLDDANVARFCTMVKEMSRQVQFMFVTHNKVTMEMANQLMGVTMNEPGVSRLVSVDIEEAAALVDV